MGVVDAIAPLMVRLDSGDEALPASCLDSYPTPVIADRVAVETGPPLIVLGKVVP
jgi:hypothetical protein